ncbi:DUF429 domain-containing protein [Roseivirga sp. E12]|uniref:DUF429 domain-containing protein n=1 Tax=Roseivirga sp. E12 TaxID=2819237 RepID=UPI001ABC3EF9|nr:DUF429 domain-containing protein [Roseivirga sp. E12]MBO3698554.1 DUF429 domain-containing protein [Roseivirga sp. E12]
MKIGIDFGSKLAGTTVIAYQKDGLIYFEKSIKNQDADQMIIEFVREQKPQMVGIDAPLSLPGVYTNLKGYEDYHYRLCDKELKAMSPMFLGGLTARAIKLKDQLSVEGVQVFETYPVQTGGGLGLKEFGYRSKASDYNAMLQVLGKRGFQLAPESKVETSHDLDSVLALMAIHNMSTANEKRSGDPNEGLIFY